MYREKDQDIDVWGNYSNGSKYTFPSFDIAKILHMYIPKIIIKKIPENIEIEETYAFTVLLGHFNKAYWTNLSAEELLYSRSSFNGFMNFITNCMLRRYLIINEEAEDRFIMSIEKLRNKYAQNLRSLEKYYDEIIRTVYRPQGLSKKDEEVREEMYLFDQAYSLMKLAFKNKRRDSWEKYFEHLKWVMEIILRELPNPNLNKILIALLHDVQEDIPEYADVVRKIYGDYIADGVNELSKKDRKIYLNTCEKEDCWPHLDAKQKLFDEIMQSLIHQHPDRAFTATEKVSEADFINAMDTDELERYTSIEKNIKPFVERAKERRNTDYFWHLEDLNDDYLDDKFADRIHNLRDMSGVTKEKTLRKIIETERYFLPVAKIRNPTGYKLMFAEIKRLKALYE